MARLLVLGNKRYSSWSLRGFLALKFAGVEFEEQVVPLFETQTHATIQALAPGAPPKVPVLVEDGHSIWDSLSIMEFAAENSLRGPLWPTDPHARARARSMVAEMHGGFIALREHVPMNLSKCEAYQPLPENVEQDVQRILSIWEACRQTYSAEGPYLFGALSLADAAFAPVVARLKSRSVPVSDVCRRYCDAVWQLPAFEEWRAAAEKEVWVIDQ
ncbi:glutathione S-transferase [Sneathiella sp.]|jgi:glutathione S-transferase|uniref:glutathione S-transferase n=1 Tax=Sneathiella sp. TaxID=1964365 RepID=UPI0039E2BA4D